MRLRNQPPKYPRALLDLRAFHEAFFVIFSLGLFLALVGLYFPFFYTPIYGSRIVNLSPSESFYLVPVLNAGPIFGRIIPGLIADKAGSSTPSSPCGISCVVLAFAWLGISNAPGLWVFCALYSIVARLSPDMSLVGTRMGMCFTFAGLGLLIGNPIAGAILNIPEGKFKGAQAYSAATLLARTAGSVAVRMLLARSGDRGGKSWKT
jgi:hypothetical protein